MNNKDVRLIDADKLLGVFCADCGMRDGSCSNSCEKDCAIFDPIQSAPTIKAITHEDFKKAVTTIYNHNSINKASAQELLLIGEAFKKVEKFLFGD